MEARRLRNALITMTGGLVLMNTAWAGASVWTFEPVSGYPPSVSVSSSGMAIVKYTVTNQSHKSHTLTVRPIQGITSSGCTSALGYHQSCTLTLTVAGSGLNGDVFGGPILCDQNNSSQCYQPSQANSLAIRLTQIPPVQQYTVTSSAGSNGSVSPSGSQTVNPGTSLIFTATPDTNYGVGQWLVDGAPVQQGGATYQLTNITANHTVDVTFGTVTLTPSVSMLGLSVNCPAASMSPDCAQKNNALTGTPRQITITNTGSGEATNVLVSSSGLPSDASVSPSSCATLAANGGQCVITVTPGAIASANASSALCTTGVQPEGSVSVTADGGLSALVNVYVLSYGCIYQGGFIYSIDDTTTNTGSIGGKTAAVGDTYPGQTSVSLATPNWGGAGTSIGSALYETSSQGANNGSANSTAIISALTTNFSSPPYNGASPVPLVNYAAGLCSLLSVNAAGATSCTSPNTCYTNWYLPAICEWGPLGAICTSGSTNIQQQLYENVLIPSATLGLVSSGFYWSSTENSFNPLNTAWYQFLGGSFRSTTNKGARIGIRCSRALTL
ncbi:NHL repeat protein [Legionella moravica]|uniref:NHL repeat protein n=1 Tax=Legionella moravica TaxID=39962 RepID=A0A378K080_9GAMM|nr:hypothetical protein [Legionella moravica]KTD35219.1 NHL repeat protein [Legionella moravica]STX62659.1 NHL repeat protein [Legionella moravica]